MVALRRESFTPEVQFRPHPPISIIKRPDSPEGSIIPLESFSLSPVLTRYMKSHPLESYGLDNLREVTNRSLRRDYEINPLHQLLKDNDIRVVKGRKTIISWYLFPQAFSAIGGKVERMSSVQGEVYEQEEVRLRRQLEIEQTKEEIARFYGEGLYQKITDYNFFHLGVGNIDDAMDLASEAFLKALNAAESYNPNLGPLKGWVNSIARRTALDFIRRKDRRGFVESTDDVVIGQDDDFDSLEREDEVRMLREAMQSLSERKRGVLVLRYFQEMSYEQISQAMGITPQSARNLRRRSVANLRRLLLEEYSALELFSP